MHTVTVELPADANIRDGDEVTIRAHAVGTRLVADNVQRRPAESERDVAERRAALAEFVRLCGGSARQRWTDEELAAARLEHLRGKHLK